MKKAKILELLKHIVLSMLIIYVILSVTVGIFGYFWTLSNPMVEHDEQLVAFKNELTKWQEVFDESKRAFNSQFEGLAQLFEDDPNNVPYDGFIVYVIIQMYQGYFAESIYIAIFGGIILGTMIYMIKNRRVNNFKLILILYASILALLLLINYMYYVFLQMPYDFESYIPIIIYTVVFTIIATTILLINRHNNRKVCDELNKEVKDVKDKN